MVRKFQGFYSHFLLHGLKTRLSFLLFTVHSLRLSWKVFHFALSFFHSIILVFGCLNIELLIQIISFNGHNYNLLWLLFWNRLQSHLISTWVQIIVPLTRQGRRVPELDLQSLRLGDSNGRHPWNRWYLLCNLSGYFIDLQFVNSSGSTAPLFFLSGGVLKWLQVLHGLLIIFKLIGIPNFRGSLRGWKNLGWRAVFSRLLFFDDKRGSYIFNFLSFIVKIWAAFHFTLFLELSFPLIFGHILLQGQFSHEISSVFHVRQ